MRINARPDEDRSRKLAFPRKVTGRTLSEVIKNAIDTYYREIKREQTRARGVFEKQGLVGCGEAEADLSSDYKSDLNGILDLKHGHR
jgi:hypothetical protein